MRIDFYELSGRFTDPLEVAGILVGKAWPAERSIAIVGPRDVLETLDAQLWEKPPARFLPHAIDDPVAPIRLVESAPQSAGLLINLDSGATLPDGRYERVLEIVPPDERARSRLRARWRDWQARGAHLHHHVLK